MVNSNLEFELPRAARSKAASFKREVYPTLLNFGLLDDEHVQKYLNCVTMEEIYKDALKENRQSITLLEQKALVEASTKTRSREKMSGSSYVTVKAPLKVRRRTALFLPRSPSLTTIITELSQSLFPLKIWKFS